jgi:hypothetical protein
VIGALVGAEFRLPFLNEAVWVGTTMTGSGEPPLAMADRHVAEGEVLVAR